MAIKFEKPEPIGGKPVIIIAVKNHGITWRNPGAADKLFEILRADDVAANLILELCLPVETDGAREVSRLIGFRIYVNFDEFDTGLAKILLDPVCIYEDIGIRVISHIRVKVLFLQPGLEYVSPCWKCI